MEQIGQSQQMIYVQIKEQLSTNTKMQHMQTDTNDTNISPLDIIRHAGIRLAKALTPAHQLPVKTD